MVKRTGAAELSFSRDDARARLQKQLDDAKQLLPRAVANYDELNAAEEKLKAWQRYAQELLRRMFTTAQYLSEFDASAIAVHTVADRYNDPSVNEILGRVFDSLRKQVAVLESLVERLDLIPEETTASPSGRVFNSEDIFIIHGHDNEARIEMENFIRKIGLKPIVLQDLPDAGNTVIEKLERYSAVGFAVALLTPDDVGCKSPYSAANEQPRARQNVIGELFYFVGLLGRGRVKAFKKGRVEYPSDIAGTIDIPMDSGENWKVALVRELRHANYVVSYP